MRVRADSGIIVCHGEVSAKRKKREGHEKFFQLACIHRAPKNAGG